MRDHLPGCEKMWEYIFCSQSLSFGITSPIVFVCVLAKFEPPLEGPPCVFVNLNPRRGPACVIIFNLCSAVCSRHLVNTSVSIKCQQKQLC